MKKESAQVIQEINQLYGLDKYPKDDYTQAMFKEFRKYGTKLLKIANYEDMKKRGIQLQQDIKDLMSKKEQFQSHLSSLQHSLDLYLSVYTPKAEETKGETAPKPKGNIKKVKSFFQIVSQLLVIGKITQNLKHVNPNPLKSSDTNLAPIAGLFTQITGLKADSETTIAEEFANTMGVLQKLYEKSNEEIELEGKKIAFSQIAEVLAHAVEKGADKFKCEEVKAEPATTSEKPVIAPPTIQVETQTSVSQPPQLALIEPSQTTPPPGLLAESKKDVGVSTPRTPMEEAEMPPDPSKAMPVSVLVAETVTEETNKDKEVNAHKESHKDEQEEHEGGNEEQQQVGTKRYGGRSGGYGRRTRWGRRGESRGYVYVKRSNY